MLLKFMQWCYEEVFPSQKDFSHLTKTVDSHYSTTTPLWWMIHEQQEMPVGVVWAGVAIDQIKGDSHAHIFLLYVQPAHRRRGLAKALMEQVKEWAQAKGYFQITIIVHQDNTQALKLYQSLGYQTQFLYLNLSC